MDPQAIAQVLAQYFVELLMPVLVYLVGQGVALARRWQVNATVARAISRAAGAAILSLRESGEPVDATSINRMVRIGVDFVHDAPSVVPLLPKAGISADRLEQLVRAELGNRPEIAAGVAR